MNRRMQLVTVGLVVAVLGLVAVLMSTDSLRSTAQQAEPDEPAASISAEPPTTSPTTGKQRQPVKQRPDRPRVRLPEPTVDAAEPDAVEQAARQRREERKARQALVPEAPEVAPDSLACVEAIAQRRTLRAATFNIHGGFQGRRLALEGIAREIARLDADLVLLQEVDRHRKRSGRRDQAQLLGQRLGMQVAYDPNSSRRSGGTIGNAVLSRFPITSVRRAPLPRGGSEPRGVMRVTVDVENVDLAVYVTHLEHTSEAVRQRQMRYIAGALRGESLPHLVGGDLNANPRTDVLAIARRVLRDAWQAAGQGDARTVPRARIDYLLHGPAMRPLRAQVVSSRISDHDVVLAAFEVGPPEACREG